MHQEMIGRDRDKCVYRCDLLLRLICTRCGAVRERQTREIRHY
jgi:hypothetical protein